MAQLRRSCLPIVDQGCCCDLKTCCKVQGWLQVVGSAISIISAISDLASASALCEIAATKGVDCFAGDNEELKSKIAATFAIYGINLIMHVILLVGAILFLVGISKGEPSKMVHFIRLMWVQLFWGSIFTIVGAVVITPLFLIVFVFMGITVYSLICANSLHILMVADQQGSYCHQPA